MMNIWPDKNRMHNLENSHKNSSLVQLLREIGQLSTDCTSTQFIHLLCEWIEWIHKCLRTSLNWNWKRKWKWNSNCLIKVTHSPQYSTNFKFRPLMRWYSVDLHLRFRFRLYILMFCHDPRISSRLFVILPSSYLCSDFDNFFHQFFFMIFYSAY